MSMLKNKQSRATASVYRQFISFVIVAVFVLQHLLIISPTSAKSAVSKSLLLVDLIPSVAVNKYQNTGTAADILELLVIQNNLDMRGMIIKDFSASMVNDTGGKFQFTTNTLWSSVPAGTLIVLRNNNTAADVTVGGGDFNVDIGLQNTTYFSNLGGTFDIATTDMLMIKATGSDPNGVTGSIHVLAGGTAGAQFTAAPTPKLRATGTSGTNQFVYVNNGTLSIADFNGTDATGAATGLIFGSGNNANNTAFINSLRNGEPTTTNPSGNGSSAPNAVQPGENTTLTVTVTPGTNPASSGITVTADLTAIGGSATQTFSGNGNTFTNQATVAAGTTTGVKNLPFTVSDSDGRSSGGSINLTVNSPGGVVDHVVISQVYGSGGNSGAAYTNDYVELYNPTGASVSLTGWTLQYASATGSGWDGSKQPLGGNIGAGEYYLVGLGTSNSSIGSPLPTTNVSGELNLSGSAGKIGLVGNGDSLVGNCPLSDADVVDFVGYGTTADCSEGDIDAPAPSSSNAIFRKSNGSQDTNVNGSDFVAQAASPRRTAPIVELGPSVLASDPRNNFTNSPRDSSLTITFSEPIFVDPQWFMINCAVTGAHNDATIASYNNGKNYVITPNVNFQPGENCSVTINKDSVHDQDTDDSAPNTDTLTANYLWSFTIATGTAPQYSPDVHLTMGNPTDAVGNVTMPNNYLMQKPEFALSYNRDRGTPNWVSWHLDDTWVGSLTRVDTFRPDPAVPSDWYRVQATDYFGSGFDRGHMVPNADRDKETSSPINQATFLMTNMIPQAPDNNQGPWAAMENDLRNNFLPANELYIVAGGVGTGGTGSNGGVTTTIAAGKVTVPASTWKVALIIPKADGDDISRVSASTRTIAVIMPNTQGIRANDWRNYLTTIDEVEQLTGYDFYENLPDAVENSIEAGVDGVNPPGTANQTINVAEDSSVSITLDAAGSGSLTYEIVSQPTNGSLDAATGATRIFTPNPDFNGTSSFTFRVKQGAQNSNVSTVTINVTEVNDAPVAAADSKTTQRNTTLTFAATDLTVNDNSGAANESGQTLTVTQVSSTAQTHGTVSLSGGQITYAPEANYTGPSAFDYEVCDNGTTGGTADIKCSIGTVNISVSMVNAPGFEGDVASRPNGDGFILSDDVVQVRRFQNTTHIADQTTDEFQRADSAPFADRGDGKILSDDVVQARRYQNGTNPKQTAGGPMTASLARTAVDNLAAKLSKTVLENAGIGNPREVRVESASGSAGQMVTVNIRVNAVGNESEYGFIISYDTSVLSNPVIGAGNAGASVRSCNSTTNPGQINCSVGGFPNNQMGSSDAGIGEIAAGNNQILITVTFTIAAMAQPGTTPLTLSNVNASSDAPQLFTPTATNGMVTILAPTAAAGEISGRVVTADGRGVFKARVTLTDQNGEEKTALTNPFGYYRFNEVAAGETYIITVRHKGYVFIPQVINFGENIGELLIIAES